MKKNRLIMMLLVLMVTTASWAQGISGTVIDNLGDAVIGASIVEKGNPQNGTISNFNGEFTLNVNEGTTIVVSYMGYLTQELKATSNMKVTLREDTKMLQDVVVVGYGVQKKSVVTAAISKVGGDDLNLTKPSRIEDALKGKVSGVQITQSSGQPNSDSKVRIRGIGSVNSSDPLYIVDGMPVDGGINYLNPTDIESVEILKDAASAAIYGSRAANGVVLVTTKSGKVGKTSISYDFSYGWQNPWREKAVLNAKEYMTIINEALVNDGNAPRYSADYINNYHGPDTNWQKETFNYNAPVMQHQLSINGGSEKATFFLSVGYFKQEGIVGGDYGLSNYERLSARSNSTYTVFEETTRNYLNKLKVGVNIGYTRDTSTGIETNSEYGSILGSAIAFSPLIAPYASDTEAAQILAEYPNAVTKNGHVFSLPPSGFQELTNPLAQLNRPSAGKNNSDKIVGSFYAELDILPGLKFRSTYGIDLAFWGYDGYGYEDYLGTMTHTDQSWVESQMNRSLRWQTENYFTYSKTFAEGHNLNIVLGQSASRYESRNLGGSDSQLFDHNPTHAHIDSAIAPETQSAVWGGNGGVTHTSLASYFGRIDYNFAERYMVQFTMRRDGSSHFGPNHKWGTFPSFSLGWNVWNEPYLQKLKPAWWNVLKIRASWGQNGNEHIPDFTYRALMNGGQNYYFGGSYVVNPDPTKPGLEAGKMVYGTSPARAANPDIKWETSTQTDIGFDMRFLSSRLTFGFDYYYKKTTDMLFELNVPTYIGQDKPYGNLGTMENWGLEFELGWKDSIKDFAYWINVNASFARNKLIELGNASGEQNYESAGASGVGDYVHAKNGEVWPYFYGYKTNGLFQNQQEVDSYVNAQGKELQPSAHPGDVRFVDFNGDGKISDEDRTKIGKGMPDWTYGFSFGAEWKGIDVNFAWQGTLGNDIFDFAQRGDVPAMNRPSWILERWHGEGTSNRIPRMTSANPNGNWKSSDLYIRNGSYLRLKNAQIGYTLPAKLTRLVSIQRLRVYVAAENLLTFTSYKGFEPELASGDYTTLGVDKGIYPQARTITVGANVAF